MAVDLGTDLQRLARDVEAARPRMQHRAGVAQARHAGPVQQVGVDAGNLRRNIGAQADRAAGQLIDQLEGLQIQIVAGAGQQRLDVLQHRRHHQLIAVGAEQVEHAAAQLLDLARLGRQHVGNGFRQQPVRHGGLAQYGNTKTVVC